MNKIKKYQIPSGPIYYSRTQTPENLSKAANKAGEWFLLGMGKVGEILNGIVTSGVTTDFGLTSPFVMSSMKERKAIQKGRLKTLDKVNEKIAQGMTWVSPLNYGTALVTGNGLNARKGQEIVETWSPAWQAVGRLGELYVGPKAVKGVKATPRAVVNTAAKAGVKPAKAAVVAREIKLGIKLNTKNGKIEVTEDYFNSPDKWYRITETPEKYGIMELGKNVTTHDASQIYGTINGWRSSILKAPITKSSEGFIKRPHKIEIGIRRKNGQAHGNTSQAAKGKLWGGTTSGSNLFPEGIIEGQAPSMINYGIDRTNFVMTPWELVPNGGRVGFHTGEMPMSNLGWFQRTNKGTYTYEPIIPEKRISYQPVKLNETGLTSLEFFERRPAKISEAERAGVPKGERNVKQGYLLKDAIEEANKFAEKWGYDKLSQNATLLDIENLYNQHNTFFRGVTTEQLENTRNRVAKELGINPELLTNDLYLLYVSTHPWPGNDRIWVTPFSHYGKIYGNSDMIGGKGLLSAVMRPWKTTKDIKQWPKLSLWTLGFKEDISNPVITPWVSNAPDAIRSLGSLSEFLVKSPLIYRGLGKDFKGTLLLQLKYNDGQGKLGWIESLVGELPLEIIIEKQGGKMNILEFLKNGSGIHIKEKNKGKFTKSAKAAGLSVQEHAKSVLNDPNATPLLKKRANFARNAAKWKHKEGGIISFAQKGMKAGLRAKQNLTKRKDPDWDNLDRGYRYLTLDRGLPHDLVIAIMGNIVEESQGNYKAVQKNGGGRGLIQWDGLPAPSSRYGLWGKIWASVAKKANVYDPDTDTVKNYWAPWNGLKGELVRLKFIKAPLKLKAKIYAESYLRPGKPRIADRQLSTMQLDSIYNPKIRNIFLKEGGIIKAQEGTKTSWWLKAGNFLNSDTGKGILNLGSNLINGVVNSSKAVDYGQEFDNATNATILAMLKKQYAKNKNLGMQYALLYINYLNQMNPDQHFGEIDKQMLSELFAKLLVDEDDIDAYKFLRALEKALLMLAIQGSGGTDWLSLGLGLVSNFLGSKKNSSTTTTNNLLNYNNIGKSTNPYMNTSLGGFVNNPTNKFFWAPSVKG